MLAKQAKDAYSLAKSYTPISLTPFIFKLLERVCACYILETALSKTPFHKRQPAYRAMRSKEFAISQVLNEIEKGMTKSSFTLGTFIDISSLFLFVYGEGRPRLDLEYPVYGAHELADEGAFTSVVVLTASFPSGFRRGTGFEPMTLPSLEASRNKFFALCLALYSISVSRLFRYLWLWA